MESERQPLISTVGNADARATAGGEVTSVSLVATNLLGDPLVLLTQGGLLLFGVLLWRMLAMHPAGLFTPHPSFQSAAVILLTQGIMVLQPTKSAPTKAKGLAWHQIFQLSGLLSLLIGATFILYNKFSHDAPHFTSWHGKLGLIALIGVITQICAGIALVYQPFTTWYGESRAKSHWKFHRMIGYVVLTLLYVTPLTALQSDWVVGNSTKGERLAMAAGLMVAAAGVASRISVSKFGVRSSSVRLE